jgi:transcriptional regulator with XRE-family HTH domain
MAGKSKHASEVGKRLQKLREAAGWTQADLATEVGRLSNAVSEWERGKREAPKRILAALAAKYGWPVTMFYPGGPSPSEIVNGPVAARSRAGAATGAPAPSEAARRYFVEVRAILKAKAHEGEAVSAEVVVDMLDGLWRRLGATPVSGNPPAGGPDRVARGAVELTDLQRERLDEPDQGEGSG